jgi:hypothetical protein
MVELEQTHYRVEQLAAKWAMSVRSVRRLIWDGKLQAKRMGPSDRSIRVPAEEVTRYERSRPAA